MHQCLINIILILRMTRYDHASSEGIHSKRCASWCVTSFLISRHSHLPTLSVSLNQLLINIQAISSNKTITKGDLKNDCRDLGLGEPRSIKFRASSYSAHFIPMAVLPKKIRQQTVERKSTKLHSSSFHLVTKAGKLNHSSNRMKLTTSITLCLV